MTLSLLLRGETVEVTLTFIIHVRQMDMSVCHTIIVSASNYSYISCITDYTMAGCLAEVVRKSRRDKIEQIS